MADLSELIAWARAEARKQRDFEAEADTVRSRRRHHYRAKQFDRIGDALGRCKRLSSNAGGDQS